MPKSPNICRICLRPNRRLRIINEQLIKFHHQLCGILTFPLEPIYCTECEHLLRKTFNFKMRCLSSLKFYDEWKKAGLPVEEICTLLPSKLSPCVVNEHTVCVYDVHDVNYKAPMKKSESTEDHLDFNVTHLEMCYECIPDLKLQMETEDLHLKNENNEENDIDMIEISNQNDIEEKNQLLIDNTTIIEKYRDANIVQNIEKKHGNITKTNEAGSNIILYVKNDSIGKSNVFVIETNNMSLINDVGYDKNDSKIPLSESRKRKVKAEKNGAKKVKNSVSFVNDVKYDSKDSKVPLGNSRKIKSKSVLKKNEVKKVKNNISSVNDVKFDSDDVNYDSTDNDDEEQLSDPSNKKSKSVLKKNEVKGFKNNISFVKKNVVKKVKDISYVYDEEYDSTDSDVTIIECEINKMKKVKNISGRSRRVQVVPIVPFSRERLKTQLEEKFEAGELKTEDGTIIDKDIIFNMLDKITDKRANLLWHWLQWDTRNWMLMQTLKILMRNHDDEKQYAKVFDIEYFNTEQKMQEEMLRRKTYECYINAKYKCEICYVVFYKPKHLENHIKMHEESYAKLACKICGLRFPKNKTLDRHENSHGMVYKCKMCPLVTYHRNSMVNHYNHHEGKQYSCEGCEKTFRTMSGYRFHLQQRHRRGRHVCTTCGRCFVSALGLAFHNAKIHKDAAPPAEGAGVHCAECDLHFPTEEAFLIHMSSWHNQQREKDKQKTDNTGTHTRVRVYRKRSKIANVKLPSITCRICNAAGNFGWLTQHFRTEHPTLDMNTVYADKRTHLCHICAKVFRNVYTLRDHLNSHLGLRPYACDLCPKRFHSGAALYSHKQRHLPPGKECKQCGKKFKTQTNLTSHMLSHSGARRHKCTICDKAFLFSSTLSEHMRGVHYNIRRERKHVRRKEVADQGVGGREISDQCVNGGEISDQCVDEEKMSYQGVYEEEMSYQVVDGGEISYQCVDESEISD